MNNNQNVPNNGQPNLNNINVVPNGQNNQQANNIDSIIMPSANVIPNNNEPVVNTANQQPVINTNQINNFDNQNAFANFSNTSDFENSGSNVNNQDMNNEQFPSQTHLDDLNVNGSYNNMEAPDYVNDQKVIENMRGNKKNTITVTKELKTIIIISLILLVFIFLMPIIFDLLNNIRFH